VSEADAADDPQTLPPFLRPILETTDASASVARRRQARLLATFLCLLFVVFGAVDLGGVLLVPGYAPPWYGYALLATAWLLNRSGRYTGAAALTLAMFPAVILGMVVSGASQHPASTLAYLAIGVQLAGILLPARGTALFAGATALAVLATPVLAPEVIPGLSTLIDPLALVAASSGLAVVSILHRDRLERDRQARLRDGEERLRLALEAAHMATWIWEAREDTLRGSQGAEAPLGVAPGAAPATGQAYLRLVHEDDRATVGRSFQEALAGGLRFAFRHRMADADAGVRWIEAHGRVDRGPDGRVLRTRGTLLDVSGAQRAEAERETLIRELESKNAELEGFTYTVSHDLKSPLITIRGFLGMIRKDLEQGRTDRLEGDVGRMALAADNMERLLHELLRLSRIGRVTNPSQRVPFALVVREAMALVQARLDGRGIRLVIEEPLPEVYGDRLRLVEVVQNLVDNAAKFIGDRADPLIRIGSRVAASPPGPVLFVEDNGLGIEPRFQEKVFGLFQKLDPGAEGSGVGLALVKRIVEGHGGRVWIESEGRDRGTRVCFTLPEPPPPG
jgi:signal transduction histidine kinase